MSNSSPIADSGRFSGQKMNFSSTCNLLSQYIKEKRSLSLSSSSPSVAAAHGAATDGYGNNNNNRATMNLFPMTGKPAEDSNRCIGHSVNLFPQFSGFNHSAVSNASAGKRGSPEPPSGQMTIFYGGQVMVFNDLPAEKAKEVMDLATTFESSLKKRKVEPPTSSSPKPNPNPNPKPNPNLNLNPTPNPNVTQNLNVTTSFANPVIPAPVQRIRIPVANAADLPIARKASLHRFLEKRKDRLIGKAPSSADVPNGGPSKPAEGTSWLGLGSLPVYQPLQQL